MLIMWKWTREIDTNSRTCHKTEAPKSPCYLHQYLPRDLFRTYWKVYIFKLSILKTFLLVYYCYYILLLSLLNARNLLKYCLGDMCVVLQEMTLMPFYLSISENLDVDYYCWQKISITLKLIGFLLLLFNTYCTYCNVQDWNIALL